MKISIVSIFQNEAKYLKEWLEFHLLVGVDQFYLVNNNSTDEYLDILNPYIKANTVKLYDIYIDVTKNNPEFKNEDLLVTEWVKKMNEIVLNCDDDWIIHISTDEFLFPTEENSIKSVLKKFPTNVGEISVNWTMFGNNGVTLKHDELLIKELTKSSLYDWEENYHVKPIVRPKAINRLPSVHFASLKPGFKKVDAQGNHNFKSCYEVKHRVLSPLHINHYRLRDLDWTFKKINMYKLFGRTNQDSLINLYNDEENHNIQRFVPILEEKIKTHRHGTRNT